MKVVLFLAGILVALIWTGQFAFALMHLSFIPADWLAHTSVPLSIAFAALTTVLLVCAPKFQLQNTGAGKKSPPSLIVLVFGFLLSLLIFKDFVSVSLPWVYTKVAGTPYKFIYEVERLGVKDRKFCIRVHLKFVDVGSVCAREIFPSAFPNSGDQVVLIGKQSRFGFLVQEGRILER